MRINNWHLFAGWLSAKQAACKYATLSPLSAGTAFLTDAVSQDDQCSHPSEKEELSRKGEAELSSALLKDCISPSSSCRERFLLDSTTESSLHLWLSFICGVSLTTCVSRSSGVPSKWIIIGVIWNFPHNKVYSLFVRAVKHWVGQNKKSIF